jgi:hypothetical protein
MISTDACRKHNTTRLRATASVTTMDYVLVTAVYYAGFYRPCDHHPDQCRYQRTCADMCAQPDVSQYSMLRLRDVPAPQRPCSKTMQRLSARKASEVKVIPSDLRSSARGASTLNMYVAGGQNCRSLCSVQSHHHKRFVTSPKCATEGRRQSHGFHLLCVSRGKLSQTTAVIHLHDKPSRGPC